MTQRKRCPRPNLGALLTAEVNEEMVAQALDAARETPDGFREPVVRHLLEVALTQIWKRIEAQPKSYIMSRNEFAVFNFFQFLDLTPRQAIMAMTARANYWSYGSDAGKRKRDSV
ncbi:hypothetical protein F4677DRAFT_431065 [Hypoxylon crocopeplum]|nr:hypothetical protein F4677DRAFT_431065 [Hypoxylon crocopeplum]